MEPGTCQQRCRSHRAHVPSAADPVNLRGGGLKRDPVDPISILGFGLFMSCEALPAVGKMAPVIQWYGTYLDLPLWTCGLCEPPGLHFS